MAHPLFRAGLLKPKSAILSALARVALILPVVLVAHAIGRALGLTSLSSLSKPGQACPRPDNAGGWLAYARGNRQLYVSLAR